MSKIINLKDSRYKFLESIWKTYEYANLWKYNENGCLYYFVTPELVVTEYVTNKVSIYKNDPDHKFNWITCYTLSRVLQYTCNLTVQEYFDLLILKINDTDDRPKCPNCGYNLTWSNRFSHGYSGVDFTTSKLSYCSQSCCAEYRLKHPETYPEFYRSQQELTIDGGRFGDIMKSDPDKYIEIQIEANKSRVLNLGSDTDKYVLYVTWTDGYQFKFGITKDTELRSSWSNFGDPYRCCHILNCDTRLNIVNLEASIKYHFNQYTEYLPESKISEFWKFIRTIL